MDTKFLFGGALTVLMALVVYHPHTLRGESSPLVFPPRRVVSLTLATDEILLALVSPERIAALTYLADDLRFSNVVAEGRAVRHRVRANAEQVIALRPDLILLAAYTDAAPKELLRQAGVSLFELRLYDSLDSIQQSILAVGQAIGEEERARSLVADMEQRLEAVRARVANAVRPRVLYYAAGGFTAGSGTTMDDMIASAGGQNLAAEAGIKGFKKISTETLVALNPETILVNEERGQEGLWGLLLADPTLQDVEAIRTRHVHVIPRPYLSTLSHHIVKGVEAIAQALHPEAFTTAGR